MEHPPQQPLEPRVPPPPPPRGRRAPGWVYVLFLALTAYTALTAGASFSAEPGVPFRGWPGLFVLIGDVKALLAGLPYAAWLFLILGSHEMGHYLACRRHGVDATPPLFLPGPQFPFGTLGAFIRIRSPFPDRNALFDVAIAGPLAGFALTLPALWIGFARSQVVPAAAPGGIGLGESAASLLLARWAAPPIPEGHTLLLHPVAYAGWVGLLATALNLLPIGQLDGGHIAYAVSARLHAASSRLACGALIALGVYYLPWAFWGLVLFLVFGARHPPVAYEHVPLSPGRRWLAVAALLLLAACFIPVPFPGLAG